MTPKTCHLQNSCQLILNATHRSPVSSGVCEHVGIAVEVEVSRIGATHRTAPIAAAGIDKIEPPIVESADSRRRQFKRGGKSTYSVLTTPA